MAAVNSIAGTSHKATDSPSDIADTIKNIISNKVAVIEEKQSVITLYFVPRVFVLFVTRSGNVSGLIYDSDESTTKYYKFTSSGSAYTNIGSDYLVSVSEKTITLKSTLADSNVTKFHFIAIK